MLIILVIAFLVPFVCLGYLISKMDKFLAEEGSIKKRAGINPAAIVLGGTDLAKQVTELLEKNRIQVTFLTEPFLFEQKQNFCYLFALSGKDADNLILCKIGKKLYGIEKMISLCNDQKNEGMFNYEKIRHVLGGEISAQVLYRAVLQEA